MALTPLALSSIIYKKWYNLTFISLALLIIFITYISPTPEGLDAPGKMMIGILVAAAILWITEPIPLAATGLFIMVLQPFFGIIPAKDVFQSFGNQAVFFLIGAFIIAAAIEASGLHKRMALNFLKRFEHSPRFLTFGIMISCATLSFIIPNHAVAAFFVPIVVSILFSMKLIPKQSNFGKICILAIAYGCSIGSLGTLIGGARNPLTIGFLSDIGINISFIDWIIYSMPVVFISIPVVWLILQISFPVENIDIILAKNEIEKQVRMQGSFTKNQLVIIGVLLTTIILWIFFSDTETMPFLGLAGIAILGSILLFLFGAITWKDIEKKVPWGIILLYGGAITLGIGMQQTGAGAWIAQQIYTFSSGNIYLIIFGLIFFAMLLTNIMSNTGAVAVLLPIGIAVSGEIPDISPLLSSMLIALSGGLAFVFIIATPGNAITYSAGFYSTRDLFRVGIVANVCCLFILFTIAIVYWKGILGI